MVEDVRFRDLAQMAPTQYMGEEMKTTFQYIVEEGFRLTVTIDHDTEEWYTTIGKYYFEYERLMQGEVADIEAIASDRIEKIKRRKA